MNNFIYVSEKYRNAVCDYVSESEDFSEEQKLAFEVLIFDEQRLLKWVGRPPSWFLNDIEGKKEEPFQMKKDHFPKIKFEYHEGLPSLHDIFMNRAEEMRDMDKEIDLFYSGGLDSAVVITALMEVCPKDQLHIIMGTDFPLKLWPKMSKRMEEYNFEIVSPHTLYSQAKIDTNLFTTGSEADRMFGSTGFPEYTSEHSKETEEINYERWWTITRHTNLTQSWRYLQDIKVSKVDLDNYQPFFFYPDILKYSINCNIEKRVVWHSDFHCPDEVFLKSKMELRDFIAKLFDKEWPYTRTKTRMFEKLPEGWKNYRYGVAAIYGDGTVIFTEDMHDNLDYGINI